MALDRRNVAAANLYSFAVLQLSGPRQALAMLKSEAGSTYSRGTLLLRAYLELRANEDLATAALCFRTADTIRPLDNSHLLAFAETLVRLGEFAEARKVLARARGAPTPAGLILEALVTSKEDNQFLPPLTALLADSRSRDEAAGAIVAVIAKDPRQPGALQILKRVPQELQDEHYRILQGACLAGQRRWSDAIAVWSAVSDRVDATGRAATERTRRFQVDATGRARRLGADQTPRQRAIFEAIHIACLNEMNDRYARGDLLGVVDAYASKRLPGEHGESADQALEFTLLRLFSQAKQGKLDGAALDRLETAAAEIGSGRIRPQAAVLFGAILAAAGRHKQALDLLSNVDCADATAIGANAALRLGKPQAAIELLDRRVSGIPRRHQLRAIAMAQLERWDSALAALDCDPADVDLRAAICFLAGRYGEIESLKSAGGAASYYKAVCFLRAARRQEGEQELARIEAGSPLRGDADRLLGWLALGSAARALHAGDIANARNALLLAALHWRDRQGESAVLTNEQLLALLIQANDRSKLREALDRASRMAGFAHARSCHQLAIFHLVQGHVCIGNREFLQAIAEWEIAIGCFAIVLACQTYMAAWRQARTNAYDFILPPEADVHAAVVETCAALFDSAAAQMDAKAAGIARLLVLSLEAELHAAGLLAQRGGLEINNQRKAFGPIALAGTAFASEVAELCLDIAETEGRPDEDDGALAGNNRTLVAAPSANEIERYFSGLRLPALLLRKGEIERALDLLERDEPICHPLCRMDHCESGPRNGCSGRGRQFVACNPAFARDGGTEDLKHTALNMQLSLLLKAAERQIVKRDVDFDQLTKLWNRAATLAKTCERSDAVQERVHKLVFGRVKALGVDQTDIACKIVEIANAQFPSDDLENEIARLTTNRAIDLANKTDDYATAVDMLRRSYQTNPHPPRVKENFITALRTLADRSFKSGDPQKCFAMLCEANEVAFEWHKQDALNPKVRETVQGIGTQHAEYLGTMGVELVEKVEKEGIQAHTGDIDKLRQAYGLNRYPPRVKEIFIAALRALADRAFKTDPQSSLTLIREAHDSAREWREYDTSDDVQKTVAAIEVRHAEFLRDMAGGVIESDRTRAAKYFQESLEVTLAWSMLPNAPQRTRELVEAIAGELAVVITGTAIRAFNTRGSTPPGLKLIEDLMLSREVDLLRAARLLDAKSEYVTLNLMLVLYDRAIEAIKGPQGLTDCVDLMNEASLIGEIWLRSGSNKEIRDLINKIAGDLRALNQARPGIAQQSKWREPARLRWLNNPTIEGGIDLLHRLNAA